MIKEILFTLLTITSISSCDSSDRSNKSRTQQGVQAQEVSSETTEQTKADYVDNVEGEVHLYGNFTGSNLNGKTLYLYETQGRDVYVLDSVQVNNNSFNFGSKEYPIGIYALGFENTQTENIILNPEEGEVEIQFLGNRVSPNYKVIKSEDNAAWKEYYLQERKINQQITGLKRKKANSSDKASVEQLIQEKQYELKDLRNSIIRKYPETFTAKVVAHLESDNPSVKAEYWSDIDFSDGSYVRSMVMHDRIQDFMIKHSGGTDTGFLNGIDYIVGKAKEGGNNQMIEYCLYQMMEGFYSSGREDMSLYILDNYVNEETCGADLSEVLASKAEGIQRLQVGHQPKDFTAPTLDGGSVNLYDEVEKNDYTLIFFWASWCHKCESEIPVLKDLHSNYKNQGFDVIGFSVDQSRGSWENAVREKNVPWHNVSELGGWSSPTPKTYRVTQTPTMFLLNNEGEIVLKPTRVHEVETFLRQKL